MTPSAPAAAARQQVEARLARLRQHVSTIQNHLARIVSWRARRIGCSAEEANALLHATTVAYFRALSQGAPPQAAIFAATDEAMLPVLSARIERARASGQPAPAAFRALIARIVDARHPDHARIVETAGAAFEGACAAGASVEDAILRARAAARG